MGLTDGNTTGIDNNKSKWRLHIQKVLCVYEGTQLPFVHMKHSKIMLIIWNKPKIFKNNTKETQ